MADLDQLRARYVVLANKGVITRLSSLEQNPHGCLPFFEARRKTWYIECKIWNGDIATPWIVWEQSEAAVLEYVLSLCEGCAGPRNN